MTIYRLISQNTIEENILKKAREKRRLGELTIDEAGFTPAFFKKNDSIRDLFYNDNDSPEVGAIRIDANEKEFEEAMELAEDNQDALDAQGVVAEIAAEEMEFSTQGAVPKFFENEEFSRMFNELNPLERYAVNFLASQLELDEDY